jgi:nucleoside-diphosphate-sugar epimerase
MTNLVILGSSGFLGKYFLNQIISEKFNVKAMIHNTNFDFVGEKFQGDILNQHDLEEHISTDDIVINFIGQIENDFSKFLDLNIDGGFNLLNASLKKKPKKIILISSINVYGESDVPSKEIDSLLPKTSYGLVKSLTEKIYENFARLHGLNITILRMANVYGPNKANGIIFNLIKSIKNPKYPTVLFNSGIQFRDFLYVDDAINAIIATAKIHQDGFNIFNISSAKRFSNLELVDAIENISGEKSYIKLNKLHSDESCIWADNSKAKKLLKFSPCFSLNDGLKILINKN